MRTNTLPTIPAYSRIADTQTPDAHAVSDTKTNNTLITKLEMGGERRQKIDMTPLEVRADRLRASITCPVFLTIFNDPVTLPSGHVVERDAAKKLSRNPFTREHFAYSSGMKTNFTMKGIVDGYLVDHEEAKKDQHGYKAPENKEDKLAVAPSAYVAHPNIVDIPPEARIEAKHDYECCCGTSDTPAGALDSAASLTASTGGIMAALGGIVGFWVSGICGKTIPFVAAVACGCGGNSACLACGACGTGLLQGMLIAAPGGCIAAAGGVCRCIACCCPPEPAAAASAMRSR